MRPMTMRERMLAVIAGEPADRVPFVQYSGLAGPNEELWHVLGRDRLGLLQWCGCCDLQTPHCRFDREELTIDGRRAVRHTLHTPKGSLTEERLIEPIYGSSSARTHYVKQPRDYEVLLAHLRDVVVTPNFDGLNQVIADLGDDGLPHCALVRTPYQQLWVQWVDGLDLAWHLVECPDLVEACAAEMGRILRDMFPIARRAPVPYIDFPDNITAPMIGPRYFRRYCVPFYDELAAALDGTGIKVFVHTDGDLRPLWADIARSGVGGLDSMSPPPDNDTSVAEAMCQWPQMTVGINFPSSVHLWEPKAIYTHTRQMLAEAAGSHRFQIQISENVPPGRWKISFPAICQAIDDHAREV